MDNTSLTNRIRSWLLFLPLFLIFVGAWISDHYTVLSATAIVLSVLVVLVEVVLVGIIIRSQNSKKRRFADAHQNGAEVAKRDYSQEVPIVHNNVADKAKMDEDIRALIKFSLEKIASSAVQAESTSRDAITKPPKFRGRHAIGYAPSRIQSGYEVITFTVAAGAIQIKNAHGIIKIRLLSTSRGSVEMVRNEGISQPQTTGTYVPQTSRFLH